MGKGVTDNDFLTELGVEIIKKLIEDDFLRLPPFKLKRVYLTERAKAYYKSYQELADYPRIPSELFLFDSCLNYEKEINEVFDIIDFGYVEEEEV